MTTALPVLPPRNVGILSRAIPGLSGFTAIGEIYDENLAPRTVYLKAFLSTSRGLINEIIYWMLCEYLDITCPTAAWVVLVEPHHLRSLWPDSPWSDGLTPCWATQEIANTGPEAVPVTESPLVADELSRWPEVWNVIALHEWLANADGNMGNYVRLNRRRFAAVDGAEIFGGQDWVGENLTRIGYIHNKLAHIIGAIKGHQVDPSAALQVVSETKRHGHALLALEQELIRWLSILCGPTEAHLAADFLKQRVGLGNTRWHKSDSIQTR